MTGLALVLTITLGLIFAGACLAAYWDDRRWEQRWGDDREPPSRLDNLDHGDDWGGWRP